MSRLSIFTKLRLLIRRLLLRLHAPGVHYVGGSDTLPPPLPKAEEEAAIKALSEGDEAAKQLLIEHNLRLVVYIARRFENTGINLEDLVSIGSIGLIKAINTFKASKSIKLATYASRCIENEILMYLRKCGSQRAEVSFDEPLNTDREMLHTAISMLADREKQIILMRFGFIGGTEYTQKEVADMMGISQSYISRLEKRIIARLHREMGRQMQV